MINNIITSPKILYSMFNLEVVKLEEIRRLAIDQICDPIDDLLVSIYSCQEEDMLCIRKYVNLLFEREGVHALSKTDMLRIYATYISSLIMGGEVSPKIGAGIISSVSRSHVVPGFHDLDPFNYASSEMEDRPEDKKFFEEAILAEAAVWTTRNYADILK